MYRGWLLICCVMVLIMVAIGGITRLTNAGLSITEWKPVTGVWFPLNEQDWLKEKLKYENTPEFRAKNYDISLLDFKKIYFIEYFHRLWGRIIGFVFIIPYLYFLRKKKVDKKSNLLFLTAVGLGFIQGIVGWYMVKSGLINTPEVNPLRLALHLFIAVLIYIILFETFLLSFKFQTIPLAGFKNLYPTILLLVVLQMVWGGLVAGHKAGWIYNSFPFMGNSLFPPTFFFYKPWWSNFFLDPAVVQFIHRLLATSILLLNVGLVTQAILVKKITRSLLGLLGIICVQFTLGVLTLILQVPLLLALIHQLFAFVLISYILYLKKMA